VLSGVIPDPDGNFIARPLISVKTLSGNWPPNFAAPPRKQGYVIGREEILSRVVKLLLGREGERVAVSGTSGVGKTVLAHLISTQPEVVNHFQDGILWARPVTYVGEGAILGAWAELFGHDISRISRIEDRTSTVEKLLRERKVLIILDGVSDAQTAAALSCGGPHCATILTTRDDRLARDYCGDSGVWPLEGLKDEHAIRFLSAQAPSIEWVDFLAKERGLQDSRSLPLALTLIAGCLKTHQTHLSKNLLQDPVTEINLKKDVRELLIDFSREGDLRRILEWSLSYLPERTGEVFRELVAFAPEPAIFSRQAATQVTGASVEDLELLSTCNLIDTDGDLLSIHQAVTEALRWPLPSAGQEKHRQYYLGLLISVSGQSGEISRIYCQSMWACTRKKVEVNRREIINALAAYQEERGLWEDYRSCGELALQACKSHSMCQEEGRLCNNLGKATHMLGDVQIALTYYRLAESLLGKDGDQSEQALVMNNIASILVENGKLEEAQTELMHALSLLEDLPGNIVQAYLHNNLGKVYDDMGLSIQARDEYLKALLILESDSDLELEMTVRFNLSLVYHSLGRKDEAFDELQNVVDIERRLDHPNFEDDVKLLERLQRELNEPKIIRWLRSKLLS